MPDASQSYDGPADIDIILEEDIIDTARAIAANPRALSILTVAVLKELTKIARQKGNLFSIWASGPR